MPRFRKEWDGPGLHEIEAYVRSVEDAVREDRPIYPWGTVYAARVTIGDRMVEFRIPDFVRARFLKRLDDAQKLRTKARKRRESST